MDFAEKKKKIIDSVLKIEKESINNFIKKT
jgi:hypothetical protein